MQIKEKTKKFHAFDLDGTLWQTDAKWKFINNKTGDVILRISQEEGALLNNGTYKNDNIHLELPSMNLWLSKEIYDKLNNIALDSIKVDFSEFTDENEINRYAENFEILLENIIHLKESGDEIGILTARGSRKSHQKILNKLVMELDKHKIRLNKNKFYFLNDTELSRSSHKSMIKKVNILLEHFIGFKIYDTGFSTNLQSKFEFIHFYDNEDVYLNEAKKINEYFKLFYEISEMYTKNQIKRKATYNELNLHDVVHKNKEIIPFNVKELA